MEGFTEEKMEVSVGMVSWNKGESLGRMALESV